MFNHISQSITMTNNQAISHHLQIQIQSKMWCTPRSKNQYQGDWY